MRNAFLVALAASDGAIEDDGDEIDHTFFVMEIARPQWDDAPTEAREPRGSTAKPPIEKPLPRTLSATPRRRRAPAGR